MIQCASMDKRPSIPDSPPRAKARRDPFDPCPTRSRRAFSPATRGRTAGGSDLPRQSRRRDHQSSGHGTGSNRRHRDSRLELSLTNPAFDDAQAVPQQGVARPLGLPDFAQNCRTLGPKRWAGRESIRRPREPPSKRPRLRPAGRRRGPRSGVVRPRWTAWGLLGPPSLPNKNRPLAPRPL